MKKLAALIVVVVASVFAIPAAHADTIVPGDESHVLSMVNATRANLGRGHLSPHDYLRGMAERQAQRMADRGDIYHNPNLGGEITSSGLDWRKVGENVGMGPNVDLIEDAFLKSPHHYENIIDPSYNIAGIGAIKGDDGRMYVVQVFANIIYKTAAPKPAAPSVAPAAAPAARAPAVAPAAKAPAPVAAAPKPRPVARYTADPNAVTGGVVVPLALSSNGPRAPQNGAFGAVGSLLRHVSSTVASWV